MLFGDTLLLLLIACSAVLSYDIVKDEQLQQLERYNFNIGIARMGFLNEQNTTKCSKELRQLLSSVVQREYWSVKVLDAFGAAPSSFAWGNYFWYNSPALCHELNEPYKISFSKRHMPPVYFNVSSPTPMRFTILYMNFTMSGYIDLKLPFERYISLGLCLPAACNMTALADYADMFFARNIFEMQRNFALQLTTVEAKQPGFGLQILWQNSSLLLISILATFAALCLTAELQTKSSNASEGFSSKLLHCFCISANYQRLRQTADHKLGCIEGLRCLVCFWVSLFHVNYYCLYTFNNVPLLFAEMEQFALQPMIQACYVVDLFFVISAFLLVFKFLNNDTQMLQIKTNGLGQNLQLFLKALIRRYLRLTPLLILTMLLADVAHNALNASTPFRLGEHNGIYCKDTWWHNLLYIQNWLNLDDICCSWTWYLACEMQYFVLCLTLLYVYAKRRRLAQFLYVALVLVFVPLAWMSYSKHHLSFHLDSIYGTLNQLYAKPWTRILPYLAGIFAGWLLHTEQQRQKPQSSHASLWLTGFWLLASCALLATSFMSYWRSTPAAVVAAIMSLGKLLFALVTGLALVLCCRNCGGSLQLLLGWRLWRTLGKFCFGIYMLVPIIIFTNFGWRQVAMQFNILSSFSESIAMLVLGLLAAVMSWLLVEQPTERLTQLLLPQEIKCVAVNK